jgi:hypothetical protein
LRARHELGRRPGKIGANVGDELRRIEEDETVLGGFKSLLAGGMREATSALVSPTSG